MINYNHYFLYDDIKNNSDFLYYVHFGAIDCNIKLFELDLTSHLMLAVNTLI